MPSKQDDIQDFTVQVVMTVLHTMRNLRRSSMEALPDTELSYPQVLVLFALLDSGEVSMSDLTHWLKIAQGVATRTVDRLVEKGLVERKRDDGDRRVVFVKLTDEGLALAQRNIDMHLEKLNSVFLEVGRNDRDKFLSLLKEIDRHLED
jgi:DNA-binding MarR family transcriptional regulator